LITAPEGVARALAEGDRDGLPLRHDLQRTVRGDAPLGPAERVDIYANMYFFRLLDVLKEDYPGLLFAIGEVAFHNLVTDYLLAHPPSHPSLRYAGRNLPDFLRAHDLLRSHPYAHDLARFEWALLDSFDAPDADRLGRSDLIAVEPDRWGELCFLAHPSVRLLALDWPVQLIRAAAESGEDFGKLEQRYTNVLVWRRDLVVHHRGLDLSQAELLRLLMQGETLARVCADVSDTFSETEAASHLAALLGAWVEMGLFSSFAVTGRGGRLVRNAG